MVQGKLHALAPGIQYQPPQPTLWPSEDDRTFPPRPRPYYGPLFSAQPFYQRRRTDVSSTDDGRPIFCYYHRLEHILQCCHRRMHHTTYNRMHAKRPTGPFHPRPSFKAHVMLMTVTRGALLSRRKLWVHDSRRPLSTIAAALRRH